MTTETRRRALAGFCGVSGVAIFAYWAIAIARGMAPGIPRFTSENWIHVAAELVTSAVLVVAAVGVARKRSWSRFAATAGLGMLLYASIDALGPFAHEADTAMMSLVAVSALAAVAMLSVVFRWRD